MLFVDEHRTISQVSGISDVRQCNDSRGASTWYSYGLIHSGRPAWTRWAMISMGARWSNRVLCMQWCSVLKQFGMTLSESRTAHGEMVGCLLCQSSNVIHTSTL